MRSPLWIFGYGSLVFRPDFPFVERRRAHAGGYARRFHQGSPDHRGTPDDLGRVLTLVACAGARCEGIAYRVDAALGDDVLARLDRREQGGYERAAIPVTLQGETDSAPERTALATTWIAIAGNPYWLGDEPLDAIAERIARAHGPSGSNREYVLRVRTALRELSIVDDHVESVAAALSAWPAPR
jgi:cation transport regulator ChaC